MKNFEKKIEDASDEELYFWVNERDFQVVPLASDELTRRELNKLQKTITTFNKQSSKQAGEMIGLTDKIRVLTVMMFLAVSAQVGIALYQVKLTADQGVGERISQAQMRLGAEEYCRQNPNAEESGLYFIDSGMPVACSDLQRQNSIVDSIRFWGN